MKNDIVEASRAIDRWQELVDAVRFKSDPEQLAVVVAVATADARAASRLIVELDELNGILEVVLSAIVMQLDISYMRNPIEQLCGRYGAGRVDNAVQSLGLPLTKVAHARYWITNRK
jgi:uncharacterized protein YbaP (TraB family)